MAVEKAIVFDDLMKGEEREGFFSGGQGRSRRGGLKGGRRGGTTRGGRRGGRSARGAGMKSAQNRAAAAKAASKSQGQTRKGSTTTSKAVAKERAAIANVQGTKYSKRLSDAVRAANQRAFDKSLQGRKEAAAKAAIQASEAKQVSPTQSSIDAQISRMDTRRGNLLEKARRNQITNAELSRLADMNRAIGLNPTTGMGLVESMRFNTKDINLGDLARVAGLVTNPIGTIASAALTGGQGILGSLKGAGQTALAALTGQEAPKSGGLGSFMDRFKNITIGPPAPTPPDRGRREPRPDAFIPPPVTPRDPNAIPVIGKPVTNQMLNEYLALAGFSPQEIQGMPAAFRFLD